MTIQKGDWFVDNENKHYQVLTENEYCIDVKHSNHFIKRYSLNKKFKGELLNDHLTFKCNKFPIYKLNGEEIYKDEKFKYANTKTLEIILNDGDEYEFLIDIDVLIIKDRTSVPVKLNFDNVKTIQYYGNNKNTFPYALTDKFTLLENCHVNDLKTHANLQLNNVTYNNIDCPVYEENGLKIYVYNESFCIENFCLYTKEMFEKICSYCFLEETREKLGFDKILIDLEIYYKHKNLHYYEDNAFLYSYLGLNVYLTHEGDIKINDKGAIYYKKARTSDLDTLRKINSNFSYDVEEIIDKLELSNKGLTISKELFHHQLKDCIYVRFHKGFWYYKPKKSGPFSHIDEQVLRLDLKDGIEGYYYNPNFKYLLDHECNFLKTFPKYDDRLRIPKEEVSIQYGDYITEKGIYTDLRMLSGVDSSGHSILLEDAIELSEKFDFELDINRIDYTYDDDPIYLGMFNRIKFEYENINRSYFYYLKLNEQLFLKNDMPFIKIDDRLFTISNGFTFFIDYENMTHYNTDVNKGSDYNYQLLTIDCNDILDEIRTFIEKEKDVLDSSVVSNFYRKNNKFFTEILFSNIYTRDHKPSKQYLDIKNKIEERFQLMIKKAGL